MIFASVGSIMPFDRLVRAVDEWAAANPAQDVFLQIGNGAYEPRHARWTRMMPHDEYRRLLSECSLFVAHVGMGSILQALEERKQVLLLPRHRELGEHTTEHQLHTADRFRGIAGLRIVDDAAALKTAMSELIERPLETSTAIPAIASEELIRNIANFLQPVRQERRQLAVRSL